MGYIEKAQDLQVFKKAFEISLHIHKLNLTLPKIEQYDLASQMRRASKSICGNLGEGFVKQKFYPGELKRFTVIALGSAGEMKIWLKYCLELEYIDASKYKQFDYEYDQIIKMLAMLALKIKNKKSKF